MSVVGNNYDKLKRYNLMELYEPSPKTDADMRINATGSSSEDAACRPSTSNEVAGDEAVSRQVNVEHMA